ncbi:MAG: cell division protein ZapA [Bacteroidales bacterium]|jgi:cell division protein ZapA|nr:cell division protein ZapA [Bacteroidales bacterium]
MDEKLSIRVNVADRYYPLKIDRSDEEKIRKAARMINEKVLQYKQRYSDKDVQDFLAMAALQYVIQVIENDGTTVTSSVLEEIQALDNQLEDFLKREY